MTAKYRIIICLAITALLFVGLEIRLWNIQVVRHSPLKNTATGQFKQNIYLNPERGRICDRAGEELALDLNVDSVFAVPSEVKGSVSTARKLSKHIGMTEKALLQKLRKKSSFVWLKRKLDPEVSVKIRKLNLNGIYFLQEKKRYYPEGSLASQVIGCVGIDSQGLSGIEKNYEEYLSTGKRKAVKITDAFGRNVVTTERAAGNRNEYSDIYLTIDKYIQHIAESELKKAYRSSKAKKATIVIQDPSTGEILALANFPSFDGNNTIEKAYKYLNNPAITDVYEPGSTFKIVASAAALENNIVRPSDRFFCENGKYMLGGFPIRDHDKEGWLNFEEIMMRSSNIGMAKIGEKLGKTMLYEYARKFGFGNFTGIELPGESSGILRKPGDWSGTSLGRISFGQEVGITAIQLISAFSCIANQGMMMQPRVVGSLRSPDGIIEEKYDPVFVRKVLSENTVKMLVSMLEGVVSNKDGTGTEASVSGYRIAGKTGTSQKYARKTGGYSQTKYTASFIGFLPANNPKVTILVIVDEPEGAYYGGLVAAPVFSKVAGKVMEYYSIPWDDCMLARVR